MEKGGLLKLPGMRERGIKRMKEKVNSTMML
jgi:hypothetical protein